MLDACEWRYRRVLGALGLVLVLFLLLLNVSGLLIAAVQTVLSLMPLSPVQAEVIYQLAYAVFYMLPFLLASLFARPIFRKRALPYRPMLAPARLSPLLPLILFAGMGLILGAAYVNSFLTQLIGYSMEGLVEEPSVSEPYQLVLQLITVCIIPGFFEELLFRGVIMTNCMPFGRIPAILISAGSFALMHQNIGQFFYTFLAGLLLGLVYDLTGSIWNCVLLHVCNNLFSVLESGLLETLSERAGAMACTALELMLLLLGALSVAVLLRRGFGKGARAAAREGFFERSLPASDSYATCPVAGNRMLRLSVTPSTVIYTVFCLIEAGALLLLAL